MLQNWELKIFHLVLVTMKKVKKNKEIKQGRKKVTVKIITMIFRTSRVMNKKMMSQGQDPQEI